MVSGKHLGLSCPFEPSRQLAVERNLDRKLTDGTRHPLEYQRRRNDLHHRYPGRQIEHLLLEVVPRLFLRLELHVDRGQVLLPDRVQPRPAALEPHTDLVRDLGHENHVLRIGWRLNYDADIHIPLHILRAMHQREHEDRDADRAGLEPEVLGEEKPNRVKRVDDRAHDVSSAFLTVITASGFCERLGSGGTTVLRRSAALRRPRLGA